MAVTALQGVVLALPGKHPRSLRVPRFLEAGKLEWTRFMIRVTGAFTGLAWSCAIWASWASPAY